MNNIQKQIDYYRQNSADIESKYAGRTIVINDNLEIEVFDNEEDGYYSGMSKYGYGNFLLSKVVDPSKQAANIVSPIITSVREL